MEGEEKMTADQGAKYRMVGERGGPKKPIKESHGGGGKVLQGGNPGINSREAQQGGKGRRSRKKLGILGRKIKKGSPNRKDQGKNKRKKKKKTGSSNDRVGEGVGRVKETWELGMTNGSYVRKRTKTKKSVGVDKENVIGGN